MSEDIRTDFLTARSSFLTGFGSAINIAGNYYLYNISPTPAEADELALKADWERVGEDIRIAASEVSRRRSR